MSKAPKILDYARPARQRATPRFAAASFIATGSYALLCIPAIFFFEHHGWDESPLHLTQFLASLMCVGCAGMYLSTRLSGHPTLISVLAWIAIVIAGVWLVVLAVVVLLFL